MTNAEIAAASKIMLGTTEAVAMYIGSTQVWKKTAYDAEITYIESNGTQFIDTGILLFDTSDVNFSIEFKANILGRSGGYSTYGNVINAMYEVSPYPGFVYRVSNESVNTLQLSGTGSIDQLGTVDNVAVRTISANTTASTHNTSTTIFAGYDSNNNPWRFVDMRLYYLKILNHGILVRDFIPVRVGQVGYLYDKISGQLFGNLGTGNFILGPDKVSISEVTELKYLDGTGTQYINTGILNSSNVIVDTIMSASGYDCLNGSEYTSQYRFKWGADGNGKIYYGYQNNHTSGVTFQLDQPCTYYLKQGEQYVKDYQGNTILSSTENLSTYSTTPIMLFKCYSGSNWVNNRGTTRIYSCKIYNNGNIMDLIPVRVGQVGYMYDKVSGQLFANAGTGNFTLGPDIVQQQQSPGGSLSDYVQNGLVFHLDGINKGNNGNWEDLIGNKVLNQVGNNVYATSNGYYFNGNSDSYLESSEFQWTGDSNVTVEVCYKEIGSDIRYYIFGFRGYNSSKHPLFYTDGSHITWSQGAYTYEASSLTTGVNYTISLNNDSGILNGNSINIESSTDYWDWNTNNKIRIGQAVSGGASNNPFKGYIYSIRIYNRKLSQLEQLQNQNVDNIRFNLGLTI